MKSHFKEALQKEYLARKCKTDKIDSWCWCLFKSRMPKPVQTLCAGMHYTSLFLIRRNIFRTKTFYRCRWVFDNAIHTYGPRHYNINIEVLIMSLLQLHAFSKILLETASLRKSLLIIATWQFFIDIKLGLLESLSVFQYAHTSEGTVKNSSFIKMLATHSYISATIN